MIFRLVRGVVSRRGKFHRLLHAIIARLRGLILISSGNAPLWLSSCISVVYWPLSQMKRPSTNFPKWRRSKRYTMAEGEGEGAKGFDVVQNPTALTMRRREETKRFLATSERYHLASREDGTRYTPRVCRSTRLYRS